MNTDTRRPSTFEKPMDLDDVLINELGQFGWFQARNLALVAVPMIMSAVISDYIFTAASIPHRCVIPECGESPGFGEVNTEWINAAIPATSSGFSSCQRFSSTGGNGTLDYCPANLFNQAATVDCDGFVYGRQNSVVYEFDLGCQEWLRTLAGTLNSIGTFLALPITGYISDRFGRRVTLIINVFNLALIGIIRAFSVNYTMYLILQILQTTLSAGTFSTAYILAAEWVGPKYRVITSATCTSMFALGQVILGAIAWGVQPWRYLILVLHVPCFLIIGYYWVLNESVRWLLSKQKFDEAKVIIRKVAKINKKEISQKSLDALTVQPLAQNNGIGRATLFQTILASKVLLRRVCTTPVWWISTALVYHGLSINSTSISETMYLNYILTAAIEIPGYFTAVLVLDRIGRKPTLSFGLFFSAACNLAFVFIPSGYATLRFIVYLLGKYGISMAFTTLYLYTSELYPTEYRHTLFAFSSMIGRIGSITAPLTPALMAYWEGIPSVLFAGMGVLSGILVLTQPETLNTKMPDTLAEAEAIGTPESKLRP